MLLLLIMLWNELHLGLASIVIVAQARGEMSREWEGDRNTTLTIIHHSGDSSQTYSRQCSAVK